MTVQKNIKRFLVRELPTSSPGLGGQARDINMQGLAVGAEHCGATSQLASAWNAEGRIALEVPSDRQSLARCVNELGEVAGVVCHESEGGHPSMWVNGRLRFLDMPQGAGAEVHSINNHSMTVGFQPNPNGVSGQAVMWNDEGARPLELPPALFSCAYDLNDQGAIVGSAFIDLQTRAFIWTDGSCQWLSPKKFGATAHAINEAGHVAGIAFNRRNSSCPFISIDGSFDLIKDLPLGHNQANAINKWGYVVGIAEVAGKDDERGDEFGFLWHAGKSVNLNDLIDPREEWKIIYAHGINDHGQIVGVGERNGVPRPILLQPDWD